MPLTRDQILASRPRLTPVDVPEWGGEVLLRPLSVAGLIAFMDAREKLPAVALYPQLVAASACDEEGRPLFGDDDLAALQAKDFEVVKRVGEAAMRLNKLADSDDEERAKN